jgi:hypothetical protein
MEDLPCARFAELAGDYVEGVLPREQASVMEAHRLGCARCRQLLVEYAGVVDVVRDATDVRMPLGARARLRRVLSRLRHPSRR